MSVAKLIGAAAALALVGGALVATPHLSQPTIDPDMALIPIAAPIDGSGDPVWGDDVTFSLDRPDFAKMDQLQLRPLDLSIIGTTELHEDLKIRRLDRRGKPFNLVNFGLLASFDFLAPMETEMEPSMTALPAEYQGQIPPPVAALDGLPVAVKGFMIPLDVHRGRVQSFVLVRSQLYCCFGQIPAMNEWIHVRMELNKRIPILTEQVITVFGTFEVGEVVENGQLMSIYRMTATAVDS